jgi:hypothetical protein
MARLLSADISTTSVFSPALSSHKGSISTSGVLNLPLGVPLNIDVNFSVVEVDCEALYPYYTHTIYR